MPSTTIANVIIVGGNSQQDQALIDLVNDYFKAVETTQDLKQVCKLMLEPKSKLFVFIGNTLGICLASYYKCLSVIKKSAHCEHKVVAAIPRKYEHEAFQAYQDHVIDDYLVCRPIYEKNRTVQVLQKQLHELKQTKVANYSLAGFLDASTHYSDELIALITEGLAEKHKKNSNLQSISQTTELYLEDAIKQIQQQRIPQLNFDDLLQTLVAPPYLLPVDVSQSIKQKTTELLHYAFELLQNETGLANSSFEPPIQLDNEGSENNHTSILELSETEPGILLVEDDVLSLQLSKTLFAKRSVALDTASNGDRALRKINEKQYSLILMDINLPDSSGVHVVESTIGGDGPNKQTPFIMLSGNKSKSMVDEAIKTGATGYLVKPLKSASIDKLFARFKLSGKTTD